MLAQGCVRRADDDADPATGETTEEGSESQQSGRNRRAQASRRPTAGATCSGRDDCSGDQVCVQGTCRYRATSVSGELLAAAAAAQEATGDWQGAMETYESAFERFREADAPVPPSIGCLAAELTLRNATDAESRERGATQADLCFRTTVPAHPARRPVLAALARLRFEGLDMNLFDGEEPAERFFTREATRPTVDVVRSDVQMPDLEPETRSHTAVRELIEGEDGRRMIAECMVQDWEGRHESEASAEIVLRFSSRLVDMGSYDVYQPRIEVERTTTSEDGFEPCLARSLPDLFDPDNRSIRGESWNQAIRINATIR